MNLLHSGFFLVIFVVVEAISGLSVDPKAKQTQDLPAVTSLPDPAQQEGEVKVIVPPAAPQTVINDKDGNKTTTSTTTTTPTTTTSTTTPTTTTSTTTTTTTAKPAPPPPTPAPAPTPTPAPSNGPWVVRNNTTNTVCIIAEMSMELNITYPGKTKEMQNTILSVFKNATVNGSCSDSTEYMDVHWGPGHWLRINFNANKTAKNFYVSGLSLNVNATVLKDAKVEPNNTIWHFENKTQEFLTPLNMSYKCSKLQNLDLKSDTDNVKAVLAFKDTQLEAYTNKTSTGFGAAQDCDIFDTPDIVPIAVGCALAILVLVVLVAYLIGRKRSQNRGYLSM